MTSCVPDKRIKVRVKIRDPTFKHVETTAHDHDISSLIKLCRQNKVIVRGGMDNICKTLAKKSQSPPPKTIDHKLIIGRTFIRYLFWKHGRCDLIRSCHNDIDFYTSSSIKNIPICYQFFTGTSERSYGYDIRSLMLFRASDVSFRNPYTHQLFTIDETDRMMRKIHWLDRFNYHCTYIQKHNTQCTITQYTIDVFSLLNAHQYVDHDWFIDLDFEGLKSLYHELYEIWNYRLPMQNNHKSSIVHGDIFENWENVRNYLPSMEKKLRMELLRNIEKLVSDGATDDYRKNGCYIFVLGLVLVSESAATSHPSMYHAAYYDS